MGVAVHCLQPRCRGLCYGRHERSDGATLALIAISVHTTPPHGAAHPLELKVDGGPVPNGDHELICRCINGKCGRSREARYMIPLEMAAACAIAFHAEHEGHEMELWLDGKKIHPPEKS